MTIPIPAKALEMHVGILGKTGSGKSNAAKVITEHLMRGGARVCYVDPTGTAWGLRQRRDGKGASDLAPVIFGGAHRDLPIGSNHGAAIAETIGTSDTSAIIDTRLMSVGERTRFFSDFAETLLQKNRGPLHLVIDEAHLFMPQGRVNDPQSGKMLHAANNLVSLGRGIGLRIILISQRPAKVHKDALTQIETLVAMRLIAPQDRRAVEDWIGEWADPKQGAELVASLASLKTGDAWVWAPELGVLDRVHFPLASTFDSGKPLEGDAIELHRIDIDAVAARLEQVASDALNNDPARLRKQIADLQKQLAAKTPSVAPNAVAVAEAEARGRAAGRSEALTAMVAQETARAARIRALLQDALSALADGPAMPLPLPDTTRKMVVVQRPAAAAQPPRAPSAAPSGGDAGLTGPQSRIIEALAFWRSLGFDAPTREQVAGASGYKPGSGNFNNLLGALRGAGLIDYPAGGAVRLTPQGVDIAPVPAAMSARNRIAPVLTAPQAKIVDALMDSQPQSRDDLAAAVGYQPGSGNYNNLLGALRTLGIIDYPSRGVVQISEWVVR